MLDVSPILNAFFSQPLFLSLVICLAIIPILRFPAHRIGLEDHPGGRKQHQEVAALVGGPAIVIAYLICINIFGLPSGYTGMTYAVLGLFIIGFIDDIHDISAGLRLVAQAAIITFALWLDDVWISDIILTENTIIGLGYLTYPITVIGILGIKNAVNMLDGLDGLSSGIILIIMSFIISISIFAGIESITLIGITLFGAVLGFWAYNYRFSWRTRASVFMGDSGSTVLGFLLPYLAIKLNIFAPELAPKTLLLWLFAIPLWDICAVVIKRIKENKSPLSAGRDHVHHVLMHSGLNVRQTLHLIYLLCIATSSFGIVGQYFNFTQLETYLVFAMFMGLYLDRVGSLTSGKKKNDNLLAEIKDDDNIVEMESVRHQKP